MNDPGQSFSGGDSRDRQMFEQDRAKRRRRGRLVAYGLCIALWVLGVVPLARDATDAREGWDVVLVYLVAGAISLGIAAVIRSVYALLRKRRRFWSPWLFLIAAVLAVAGYAVQSAGEEAVPIAGASARESRAGSHGQVDGG